jgi:GNAT superfamily N-acetyltransferase
MQEITIRRSTTSDWDIIQKLNFELYENSYQYDDFMDPNDPMTEKSTKEFHDDVANPTKFCAIAEVDKSPVGYLVGGENNYSWRTNKRGEIFHMAVSAPYRSLGIGSKLVTEFKIWCLSKGLTHVAATAYAKDQKAQNFYQKQGLTPIDVTLEGPILTNENHN